jgi:hypothetical protein
MHRNGSKPVSPKALEAQVAKLVQGQQALSNQLEELALQISLAHSGLGPAPRSSTPPISEQEQQLAEPKPAALWHRLYDTTSSGSSIQPWVWAAAGALAGTTATLLLMRSRSS